jgi:CubicO group peptidase (beta-lactamase class C family)
LWPPVVFIIFLQKKQLGKIMATKKLEQDTQITSASGCTFTAEKGWFVTQSDVMILLEEPDRELTVMLIENKENTAEQAVLSAWKQARPNFAYNIQHTLKNVPQDGWDEIVQFMYDTSLVQEKLFVFATARRFGSVWYIELVCGTKAAFERRMAGVLLVSTSFKVPGTQEESFADKKVHILNATQLKEFATFVEDARIMSKVPGAAVAIVQDGKIIFEQGFGVRALSKPEKVTPQTLFMIGSTTKALTTFMMARLIDEGKFTWDTPVTQIMPDFALGDAATTKQVLMKYMVSASTGIPRQDMELLFNYDQGTPALRIKEMRNMKPTTGFGETFQYSNGMVCAGGYIAAHTVDKNSDLGKAYDTVMQSRLFTPIGMQATTLDFSRVEKTNHAAPHGLDLHNTFIPFDISYEKWVESIRPAGGIWSNVDDMARYLIMELNNGVTAEGKRVISEKNLLARREPQIKITDKISYGLGLMTENDHGVEVVSHGGMTMGFSSNLLFLPEHNVGLVILTNGRGSALMQGIKRKFMELLFHGKPQAQSMIKMDVEQQDKMFAKNLEIINFKPDSTWLKQFVGVYENPVLGQIIIRETPDGAELDARLWKSALGEIREKHKLILTDLPFAGLEFLPLQKNGIQQLVLESGQHKYVFECKQ